SATVPRMVQAIENRSGLYCSNTCTNSADALFSAAPDIKSQTSIAFYIPVPEIPTLEKDPRKNWPAGIMLFQQENEHLQEHTCATSGYDQNTRDIVTALKRYFDFGISCKYDLGSLTSCLSAFQRSTVLHAAVSEDFAKYKHCESAHPL